MSLGETKPRQEGAPWSRRCSACGGVSAGVHQDVPVSSVAPRMGLLLAVSAPRCCCCWEVFSTSSADLGCGCSAGAPGLPMSLSGRWHLVVGRCLGLLSRLRPSITCRKLQGKAGPAGDGNVVSLRGGSKAK